MKRRSERWERRRLDAQTLAEELASRPKVGFPVNLRLLADACHVRRITFRPMIVEGGLGILSNGFELFVRSESFGYEALQEQFESAPDGSELPEDVRHKIRFTIAHELAHTLFYDWSITPPRRRFPVNHPRTLKALEQACNKIAAILLIPKDALRQYYRTANFHDPEALSAIAARSLVAKSVFIMRLPEIDVAIQPQAILATARRKDRELLVENIWRHYSFGTRFLQLQDGKPLIGVTAHGTELLDLRIYGGYFDRVTLDVRVARKTEQWTLAVEPTAPRTGPDSFFVSLFRSDDYREDSK